MWMQSVPRRSVWWQILALAKWPLGHSQVFHVWGHAEVSLEPFCFLSLAFFFVLEPFTTQNSFVSPVTMRRRGEYGSLFPINPAAQQHSFPWGVKQDANSGVPVLDETSLISTNLWLQTGVSANLLKSLQAARSWKTKPKLIVITVVHHICSSDLAGSDDVWSVLLVRYYMLSWGW